MSYSTVAHCASPVRSYCAYGGSIRSEIPLPLPELRRSAETVLFDLEIRIVDQSLAEVIPGGVQLHGNPMSGFDSGQFVDGSSYVHWQDVGEVFVSKNGQSILCHPFHEANSESFQVYLLGQALSVALVKRGFEPLHATAVVIAGHAIALLGDCGFGKSTLAAAFLQAGHRLLTDDLLLLRTTKRGILAYPGAPRIKLFPETASRFMGKTASGIPMNPTTEKLIIPLDDNQTCADAVPLRAIYALAPPDDATGGVHIGSISKKGAFVTLLGSAFNCTIVDLDRPRRQFEATQALANLGTVRRLSYPRSFQCLPSVREAILADVYAEKSNFE